MATVNKRVMAPQATVINGVDLGGTMTAAISEGYENILKSAPDGLQLPTIDREIQFCRGTIVSQDWTEAINLLTGTVGTYVFYERSSGVAAATGYIKHTLTSPVIHRIAIRLTKGGFAQVEFGFECKAADETTTLADMHAMTDGQAAPSDISSARGGFRVTTTAHGDVSVYHVTDFTFSLQLPLARACNDADIAYTAVDTILTGLSASGSIGFQDSEITSAKLKCQDLLLASAANLVLTVVQSQGATSKVITIANTVFLSAGENSDVGAQYTGYSAQFDIANDPDTPLTLEGDNKIITIA